jgi:creatinine amidohydrolase/Fe(II)-dependent formamide hydrolase-like protein
MGAQDHTGPVFALLSDPEETTLDWIIRQRKVGQAAIAFLVAPRQSTIERLADAGWLCVPVHPLAEPGDAWLAAAMESGYARGAH